MDRFAERMIARGPTLAADRETWTGSLHILDLPSVEAAHEFVAREPYSRAGLFEEHLIRRFRDLLGRTMWESAGDSEDPRFLAISEGPAARLADLPPERLNVHGELLALDDARPAGVALALQAPTRQAVEALLVGSRFEIHDWEFGGRR
jgi:uncharacterized protein